MSIYVGRTNNSASILAGMSENNSKMAMRQKGFVSTTQPLNPVEGDYWINSSSLPTTFPVSSGVKRYINGQWVNSGPYSPERFDLWTSYDSSTGYINYYWDPNQSKWMKLDDSALYVKGTVGSNTDITVTNLGAMSSSDFATKKNSVPNNSLVAVW